MRINAVGVSDAHVVGYGTATKLPIGRLFEAIGRQQSCLQDACRASYRTATELPIGRRKRL